jgi:hypothetical protein
MQTLLPQGLPVEFESVSNVTATNSVNLGEVRMVNGEEYLYVYNAGVQQISQGQCAVLSANSGFSVTVSSVTGYDYVIGFAKHATITTGGYGWLVTRGFTKVQNAMASTALAVGDPIVVAGQGGVQGLNVSTTALCGNVGMLAAIGPLGVVVSACASGASANSLAVAYVRCYGT